jgi:hypothetical protein
MKKVKSKLIILLLFCLSVNTFAQIKVSSKTNINEGSERPYFEISIQYLNESNINRVIWLQNWRFTPLLFDSCLFHGIPTETNRVNFLFLMPEDIDLYRHFDDNEEYSNISNKLYNSSIKILKPNKIFIENLRFYDSAIIDYVKNNKFNIAIIYSIAKFKNIKSIVDFDKKKLEFYPLDTLNIFNLSSVYTNSSLDIDSYNFKYNILKSYEIDMLEANKLFKKYIYISNGINDVF